MTPDLPPVLPGFSEPIDGPLKETAYESPDIAGFESGVWDVGYSGCLEIPYSLRLGSAIARANGIGGEEIPRKCTECEEEISDDGDGHNSRCGRFRMPPEGLEISPTPEARGVSTEEELVNVKEVLGTLIVWLYSELGEANVKTLLRKLNK